MNNTARKDDVVIKLDDYLNKKENIKESKNTFEPNKHIEEKKELLRKMFDEFLESDCFSKESNDKEEAIVDKDDNKVIKNYETVNTIKTNICDNCKEVELMKLKAKQPIPKAIIIYIVMSSISFGVFATTLIITLILKVKILSIESCIVGMLSTLGLLITSVVSINDWRKFIKNV